MKLTYCILAHVVTVYVLCQDYDDHLRLFRDRFKSENYSTDIRPLRNQSRTLFVSVNFHVLNIVGIDDIAQSFTCNGLFDFIWVDEILAWDPSDYNGQWVINPKPVDIWRPRLMLTNTLDKRDLFEDDLAPVTVTSHGIVRWFPGSLFTSSCELNMINYPFDRHECTVEFQSMIHLRKDLDFHISPLHLEMNSSYFSYRKSNEWDLKLYGINTESNSFWSHISITFIVQRRPLYILLNVILPAIFLSFLNIIVFCIPANSGEKISYGITVLLALSVFLATVAGMLPKSSNVPLITIYLFFLLIISMLTVINSIIIVYLHHKEEKEEHLLKVRAYFSRAINKITKLRHAASPMTGAAEDKINQIEDLGNEYGTPGTETDKQESKKQKQEGPMGNRYKIIGRYIDQVSFAVFLVMWSAATITVMIKITAKQPFTIDTTEYKTRELDL